VSAPFWGETPPATPVPPAHAEQIAREVFGIDGTATPLGSNQETNLRIRTGRRSYVLKIANPAFGADVLELQNAAMRQVEQARTGLAVPLPVTARDGADLTVVPPGRRSPEPTTGRARHPAAADRLRPRPGALSGHRAGP
jgi:Ser/Thr protein kinase RdoA (MazF antagonist)